ncbi:hypothetical protein GYMLUDRAFT_618790 [Collybiopsis luxurians FD-317 M1]|uniref:Uncharacterized protein n=1 Tax=Collybiopsis luxurians FD-317 M1 TaxID=944289 RepID=A0A0D0B929_9AGAR|nr:hypothetical protein GYMLUDRAFT_618790 [Collybiopsis luxurians FD-317 M1]
MNRVTYKENAYTASNGWSNFHHHHPKPPTPIQPLPAIVSALNWARTLITAYRRFLLSKFGSLCVLLFCYSIFTAVVHDVQLLFP